MEYCRKHRSIWSHYNLYWLSVLIDDSRSAGERSARRRLLSRCMECRTVGISPLSRQNHRPPGVSIANDREDKPGWRISWYTGRRWTRSRSGLVRWQACRLSPQADISGPGVSPSSCLGDRVACRASRTPFAVRSMFYLATAAAPDPPRRWGSPDASCARASVAAACSWTSRGCNTCRRASRANWESAWWRCYRYPVTFSGRSSSSEWGLTTETATTAPVVTTCCARRHFSYRNRCPGACRPTERTMIGDASCGTACATLRPRLSCSPSCKPCIGKASGCRVSSSESSGDRWENEILIRILILFESSWRQTRLKRA